MYETWLIEEVCFVRDITQLYVCDVTHIKLHDMAEMRLAMLLVIDKVCFVWDIPQQYVWDVTHSRVRHDLIICETWLIHTRDVTHAYTTTRHDMVVQSLDVIGAVCLVWNVTDFIYMRRDSFTCVTWLNHLWNMTCSYTRRDSCIYDYTTRWSIGWRRWMSLTRCVWYEMWLIYLYEMWLIHMWDMTYVYMRHDSFIPKMWLMHIRLCDTVEERLATLDVIDEVCRVWNVT